MYKLVVFVSKRALELAECATRLIDALPDTKVTTLAMQEIALGKVKMSLEPPKAGKEGK